MLVRTYRLTDKFGVLLLKSGSALFGTTLDGAQLIVGSIGRSGGGILGILLAILLAIAGVIKRILLIIWRIIRTILGGIGAVALMLVSRVAGSTSRGGSTARAGTSGTATGVMARRAARAELEVSLREDPLRTQNRVLSGLVVVFLAALIGVVLWATSPARNTTSLSPVDTTNLNPFQNSTVVATSVGEVVPFATAVPTATEVAPVLQAGGSIAYVVREKGQQDIWVTNVGGRTPIRLTNSPADERDPAWSPDGRRLAYASRQDGNWDIYVYDLDSGNPPTRMTLGLDFEAGPQWSPDGQWLVYESYRGNNLDIYFVPLDSSELPASMPGNSDAPDFSPAWSPEAAQAGRKIAFVSWRDGNQDIYIYSLDTDETINLTNTPTRHEDYPVWSPDGRMIAYSAVDGGLEKVFVKPADDPQAEAQAVGLGRTPAWSPDSTSLIFAVDSVESTQFVAVAAPNTITGVATGVISVALGASDPSWTDVPLPAALVNSGGVGPAITEDLFIEQVDPLDERGLYRLGPLTGVRTASPFLNDRVNDSFNALREALLAQSGVDFLGVLGDGFWRLEDRPPAGEDPRTWYRTGRQFGFNRNAIAGFPPPIEVVREDLGVNVMWRVYLRVADEAQTGQLGEPLRHMPWDFQSVNEGDVTAFEQGGRLRREMPSGYYIDLTQLAADYGWLRVPAGSDWRANVNSVNYWVFRKTDGLEWLDAMRELYSEGELINFAPTPTAIPPTPEPTIEGD